MRGNEDKLSKIKRYAQTIKILDIEIRSASGPVHEVIPNPAQIMA